MAHNIVETATYDAVVPVPDDGDPRTAASVNGALQALADRSKYLKNAIDSGLIQAQPVASLAALAALPAPTTNAVAFVPFWGLYVYDLASTAASSSPRRRQRPGGG